jgi:apolipoprotein N-acyltransferase
MNRAQQKRRLILSPILGLFGGVLGLVTAPNLLLWALCMIGCLLLAPLTARLIDASDRMTPSSASSWVGAAGGGIGAVALWSLIPRDNPRPSLFVMGIVLVALTAGMGLSAFRRLRSVADPTG